jgi:hypothetical protein
MGLTRQQRVWRDRAESLIGLAAPALDLLLNTGERVSGWLAPEDRDYYPIRPAGETFEFEAARAEAEAPRPREPAD